MKILIVDTASYDRAPYLKYYESACRECNADYELFLWDRDNEGGLQKKDNCFTFHKICPFGNGKLRKLLPLFLYRKNLIKVIKENKYTHLILINTLASVMISSYVFKHFKNKYIMDVRDYTYERVNVYKNLVDKLINYSYFSTVSSEGFFQFLNRNEKIILNHNISNIGDKIEKPSLTNKKKIVIGFVGSVRYENENCRLIEALNNNHNYEMLYYGPLVNGCNIDEKAKKLGAKNVAFLGTFRNDQKADIYKRIDIINSLYGNASLEVTTAVPNRYYDALLFKKPIIASKGTFLGELVQKNHLGIAVDIFRDDIEKLLNKYIKSFDSSQFLNCCNRELDKVLQEQKSYYNFIQKFIKDEGSYK